MTFQKVPKTVDMIWAEQHPKIRKWLASSQIKLQTITNYRRVMCRFLIRHKKMTTKEFLNFALSDRQKFLIDVKTELGLVQSAATAFNMKAAINSFLTFYETKVQVTNKIRLRKTWKRKELAWPDAQRMISKMHEPYESVCRFMLASAGTSFVKSTQVPRFRQTLRSRCGMINHTFESTCPPENERVRTLFRKPQTTNARSGSWV